MRKHREIKLVTTEARRNYLISEPNYRSTKFYKILYKENLISIRNEKTEIFINKAVFLGLSLLEFSKILTYEFWYDYAKPKYGEKTKLFCKDIDSFSYT